MHAGREGAPLSRARDEGDEARLRGCLVFSLSIKRRLLCRWIGWDFCMTSVVLWKIFRTCTMVLIGLLRAVGLLLKVLGPLQNAR
jgi:hypothetical protein